MSQDGAPAAPARVARLLPVVALLGLGLPFLGSAHKIDDPLYLAAARHVLGHPMDPLGGPSFWHDRTGRSFDDFYNPPLVAYLLAPAVALGGSEQIVHLLMLGLAAWALVVLGELGRRLGAPASLALVLAASPALLACSLSAMTDVPFLLLSALAWQQAERGRAGRAGLLVGLSALTKYVGLLNLPLVALLLGGRRRAALATIPALGLFAAWWLASDALYGQPHAVAASRFLAFSLAGQAEYLASFVAGLGLAGAPAAVVLLRWDRVTTGAALVAGGAAGAGFAAVGASLANATLAALAFGSGVALLSAAVRATATAARRAPFATAAFWLYAAWAGVFVYFGTARYLLPLVAPLAWLLHAAGRLRVESRLRVVLAVFAALACSLALQFADAGEAAALREAARRLPGTGRVLHTGRWGFAGYAEAAGHAALRPDAVLAAGDVLAEPQGIHTAGPWPAQAALLAPAGEIHVATPALRVMDERARAGFYSSAWGLLPLGWRPGAAQSVRLRRVPEWLDRVLATPPAEPVALDVGSEDARHALLGGWSHDEAVEEAGVARTYAWALGNEASLRVPLPPGIDRLRLRVSADPAALGRLRVSVGDHAEAVLVLAAGWRDYDVPLAGEVAGGPTTLRFRPAGQRRPGRFDADQRESSFALDWIGFGTSEAGNRGAWPVPFAEDTPGMMLTGARLEWTPGPSPERGVLRVLEGGAEISAAGSALWSGDSTACFGGCPFEIAAPPGTRLVLRADRASLRLDP